MRKRNRFWFEAGLVLFILAFFFIPRLGGLKSFLIVDEPDWLTIGANYYYALTHFDFGKTIYMYHPAVTTMWLGLAGMLFVFPEYRGLGQGYLSEKVIDTFFLEHGVHPLALIGAMRLLQVIFIAALLLVVYFLLQKLIEKQVAFAAVILIAGEPFFIGQSRVINHEGMLSQFSLIAVLALMVYLQRERKSFYLLLSAVVAGLANGTKSSAIVLLPMAALLIFQDGRQDGLKRNIGRMIKTFGIWFALLAMTYVTVWPGMWVEPATMLSAVYGDAFSYAFRGVAAAVPNMNSTKLSAFTEFFQHLGTILWRTTPIFWAGILFSVFAFFKKKYLSRNEGWVTFNMSLLAFGMILLFSIAGGRNSIHYFLTSYVSLTVVAAIGMVSLFRWLADKLKVNATPLVYAGILLLGTTLLWMASAQYPYYYTYYNPIIAWSSPENSRVYGYGEGLEQAAEYLSTKENAEDLKVISWYARGPVSYYFPGQVEYIYLVENVDANFVESLRNTDYLVIYYPQQVRRNMPANLMQAIALYAPEKIIKWNGEDYVGIYNLSEMPEAFFNSLP